MKYQVTIELPAEANPGNENHMEALLNNPSNKIKVLEVTKL